MKTTVPSTSLVNIALDQLTDAPDNPRSRVDEAALGDLIDSMSSVGLLHPIVVRPLEVPANKRAAYEIVCGHRRRAAAARLQWPTIPATVQNLTPAQASDLALVENLQREDLTELEEAQGYAQLVARGQTPDEIAARLGRSASTVQNRLVLVNLPEAAVAAMREGRMTPSVATLIGRLPGTQQREDATAAVLAEESRDWDSVSEQTVISPLSFREARTLIKRQFMLGLEEPPFDANDAYLVPASGACGPCRHRTGNQVTLFGDIVAQRGGSEVCTYPPCFEQKRQAWVDQVLATATEAGLATLPAKKAAKIFTANGWLHNNSGFVDADEKRPGSKKTWRESLGKKAPTELVTCSPEGKAVHLYRKKDVDQLLEAKAEKTAGKKSATPGTTSADRDLHRRRLVREAAQNAVCRAVVDAASGAWSSMRRIIAVELLYADDLSGTVWERRDLGYGGGGRDGLQTYVAALSDAEVDGLIAEVALCQVIEDAVAGRAGDSGAAVISEVEKACGFTMLDAMQAAGRQVDEEAGHE